MKKMSKEETSSYEIFFFSGTARGDSSAIRDTLVLKWRGVFIDTQPVMKYVRR